MVCLGLVCFLEVWCMSPNVAWSWCVVGGEAFRWQMSRSTWVEFASSGFYNVITTQQLRTEQLSGNNGITEATAAGCLYILQLMPFVAWLCADMLPPTLANRWSPLFLSLQIGVAVAASGFGAMFGFVLVVVATVGMFVVWPLCHKRGPSAHPVAAALQTV